MVAAIDSRSKVARAGCSSAITTSAPYRPSASAFCATPGAPATKACTSPPPVASARRRPTATASVANFRSSPPRVSANTRTFAMSLCASENLGFGLKELDQLRHGSRTFADDAAGRAIRWQCHPLHDDADRAEVGWFGLEGLFLCCHDSLERRIARTRDTLVDRDDSRQGERHELGRAFELAARGSFAISNF